MVTLMYIGAVLLGMAVLLLLAQGAGWALTEWRGPMINIKPMNCRPCLTFWITLTLGIGMLLGLASATADRTAITLIMAFINYFYIKTKVQVYE